MAKIIGERGFVTIATGKTRYRKLAYNLLLSYRKNAGCSYPFALITDRKDEYSDAFDYTVLIDNPSNSYNDKLRLFEYLPFSETIFIDADSLVYADLNSWWERFSKAGDFCAFGISFDDLSSTKGWFRPSGMREFTDKVKFIPIYNGGVYYMRNTAQCEEVFRIACHCAAHYSDYAFNGFENPADEPVLALGMAVCGFRPINNELGNHAEYFFAPKRKTIDADIIAGKAIVTKGDKALSGKLIHWSNYLTEKSLYQYEVYRLRQNIQNKGIFSLRFRLYDIKAVILRYYRALKRKLKNHG